MNLNQLVEQAMNIQIQNPEHGEDEVFIQNKDGDNEIIEIVFCEQTDSDEACVLVKQGVSV